jgi:hypothetical protein
LALFLFWLVLASKFSINDDVDPKKKNSSANRKSGRVSKQASARTFAPKKDKINTGKKIVSDAEDDEILSVGDGKKKRGSLRASSLASSKPTSGASLQKSAGSEQMGSKTTKADIDPLELSDESTAESPPPKSLVTKRQSVSISAKTGQRKGAGESSRDDDCIEPGIMRNPAKSRHRESDEYLGESPPRKHPTSVKAKIGHGEIPPHHVSEDSRHEHLVRTLERENAYLRMKQAMAPRSDMRDMGERYVAL